MRILELEADIPKSSHPIIIISPDWKRVVVAWIFKKEKMIPPYQNVAKYKKGNWNFSADSLGYRKILGNSENNP